MEDNRDFYIDGEQVSETQFYDQLHHSVEETANQMTYLPQFDEEVYLEFMQLVTQVDTYGILEWRNHTYERRGEIIYTPIERFNNFVEEMQSVSGRIDKENILTKYINDVELKEILNFIFNPYIITGISSKKINKFKNYFDPLYNDVPDSYRDVMSMLEYLKEHKEEREKEEALTELLTNPAMEIAENGALKSDVQDEVAKMLNKMMLLEEDVKGAAVDESL